MADEYEPLGQMALLHVKVWEVPFGLKNEEGWCNVEGLEPVYVRDAGDTYFTRPFKVVVRKPEDDDEDIEVNVYNVDEDTGNYTLLSTFWPRKVYLGAGLIDGGEIEELENEQLKGNTVLLEMEEGGDYVFIGNEEIFSFRLADGDKLVKFQSPVENDMSYPCIFGEKNFYGLLGLEDCVPLSELAAENGPWASDGYSRYYSSVNTHPFPLPSYKQIRERL